ncbi:hypothetical protein HZB58_00615 [Candidatus Gottesmanbacteria bacterium]|nr:hypothetical protein [Candidatus Gottesmanbacteria bacterium]
MAFGGEKLLRDLRDENVMQSPAEVEAALEMEKLLRPNPEHGRKRTYLSGGGDKLQETARPAGRGVRLARAHVGRGGA